MQQRINQRIKPKQNSATLKSKSKSDSHTIIHTVEFEINYGNAVVLSYFHAPYSILDTRLYGLSFTSFIASLVRALACVQCWSFQWATTGCSIWLTGSPGRTETYRATLPPSFSLEPSLSLPAPRSDKTASLTYLVLDK